MSRSGGTFSLMRACWARVGGVAGSLLLATACLDAGLIGRDVDGDGVLAQGWGGTDCNDGDAAVYPGASETCDGVDNTCDGVIDEGFSDTDLDGVPDCRATEGCDGLDNDGDGRIDEGFPDVDQDGLPDCLDVEVCDGIDNTGDGQVDEGFDRDGQGGADCLDDDLDGYSEADGDCNDASAGASPAHTWDVRDGLDSDCDRQVDGTGQLSQAPTSIESSVDDDFLGISVVVPGDMDGDGRPDLLIGARNADGLGRTDCGAVYFFSGGGYRTGRIQLTSADAVLYGAGAGDHLGFSLATLGDFNRDGLADVAIGAPEATLSVGGLEYPNIGAVYLLLGRRASFEGSVGIETIVSGQVSGATAHVGLGRSVAGPGDLNGDGFADLLVAAPDASGEVEGQVLANTGDVYLFYGNPLGLTGNISALDAAAIFRGVRGSGLFGEGLTGLGDVNGDGLPDFAIGEPYAAEGGSAFLILGEPDLRGTFLMNGTAHLPHLTLVGNEGDQVGRLMTGPGDVNGDGLSDWVIAAPVTAGSLPGRLSLILGSRNLPEGIVPIQTADVTFQESVGGELGQGLGAVGDVNGDGLADFVAVNPVKARFSLTFLLFLGRTRYQNDYYEASGAADALFEGSFQPQLFALFRSSIAGADLTGDGYSEMLLGLPRTNSPSDGGHVYVYPGY